MSRIDDMLAVSDAATGKDYKFTGSQVIAAMLGAATARTTYDASYWTPNSSPTVHYTALGTDGSVLTSRRTSGVTLTQGFYLFSQNVLNVVEFIAVWDEGDPADYSHEWIVVPK